PTPDEFDPALFPLTIQLGVNLIRNAKSSRLVAEAVPVHVGGRVLVVRTDVRDTDGRLFATVTNTLVPASSREADAGRREKSE
ncbi:MAG: PaaI family thioesterase, partial [Chloroflexi bacterium]|nr:PaaI family thioesterase [Chloroflexota bacterium]